MRLIAIIFLFCFVIGSAQERRLEYRIEAADTSSLMHARLWDFSMASVLSRENGLSCTVYGDSLLGEYASGYREWFVIRKDTLYYAGEECREYIISPSFLSPSWLFPLKQGHVQLNSIESEGRRYSRYQYNESGEISNEVGCVGNLVLFAGDTLRNVVLTREIKRVPEYERTIYRWYADQSFLPVAVQRIIKRYDSAVEAEELYVLSPEDLEEFHSQVAANNIKENELKLILEAVKVDYSDGTLRIDMPSEWDFTIPLQIDVMDVAGNIYDHQIFEVSQSASLSISLQSLSPREYIVGVSTPILPQMQIKNYIVVR